MTRLLKFLERPAAVPVIIGVLMTAFWAIRVTFLDGLGGDEAEQVLFAQSFRWGYDTANPPLYTWLLIGLFAVFGKSVAVVLAFKFVTLGAVYSFLHQAARRALGPDRELDAALSALSPVLLFFVGWYVLFSYSHSLFNTLLVIVTFWAILELVRDGGWINYTILGAAVGLGMLTKYSYGLFALGLLAAALSLSEARRHILSPRIFASALVAFLVFAPHGLWLLDNAQALREAVTYKLEIDTATPWLVGVGQGVLSLGRALLAFLSPFWAIYVLVFPAVVLPVVAPAERPLAAPLLGRCFAVVLLIMATMVVVGGVTHFRGNYLFLLILLPLWAFARIPAEINPDWRRKTYAGIVVGAAVVSLGAMALKPIADPLRCVKCQDLMPYAKLAEDLEAHGFTGGTLYAHWYPVPLAGNLALHLENARAVSTKFPHIRPPRYGPPGQCLLVWVPVEQGGTDAPSFRKWMQRDFAVEIPADTPVTRLELPVPRASGKNVLVDFMLLDPGLGDCR